MATRTSRHIVLTAQTAVSPGRAPKSNGKGSGDRLPRLPEKPEEMSQRDYLIMLLHIAAELEHALMVEYLFAAYSLGGPGAAGHEREVREWGDAILSGAREGKGQLITVQNILLLMGGPVSFERSDSPGSSPFYPFEFRLEPLSLKSLAC